MTDAFIIWGLGLYLAFIGVLFLLLLRWTPTMKTKTFRVSWEFKPNDCWLGVFFKEEQLGPYSTLHVWFCFIPMFPLHFEHVTTRSTK